MSEQLTSTSGIIVDDARPLPSNKPSTDAEKIIWSHAFWARLNHEQEKFTPSVAKACADEVLRHARDAGVIETMATALKGSTK